MSTYTAAEQAANRGKLVAALRSGEFPQARGTLREEGGFCCLGVGCEVAAREGVIPVWDGGSYEGSNSLLPKSVQDWLGFHDWFGTLSANVNYGYTVDGYEEEADCLTELNDTANWTFAQIADLIEAGGVKLAKVES